jgi:uncharacterized protein (DUF433 family)
MRPRSEIASENPFAYILSMIAGTEVSHIQVDAEGVAWISGAHVRVREVVLEKSVHGLSPEEIHFQYPHLSLAQVHSALAYYYDHQEQIDREIQKSTDRVASLRRELEAPETQTKYRTRLNA